MKISRVFQPVTLSRGRLQLDKKAVQHIAHALRMKPGDPIEVFNGTGGAWTGELQTVSKRNVEVVLHQFHSENFDSSLRIHLAQAVSKGLRMDYVMQKATELSVHSITPIITERTEVKLDESRWKKKVEGWQYHVYSACEQCGLNTPPIVRSPTSLEQWTRSNHPFNTCVVLHPYHDSPNDLETAVASANTHIGLLVGPEGGFSDTEIKGLQQHNVTPIALGPRILRTETAPIVAMTLMQYFSGNLS